MHNDVDNGNLIGFSFCFTGTLESMTRNEAKEKIETLGGVAVNSITRDLSFLVTNDTESGTSKNRQARKNNISIINENEFTDIINAPEKAIDYNKMKKTTAKTASFETEGLDIAELALVDEQKETKIHFKPPVSVEIVYRDSMGEVTERKIDIFTRKSNRSDMEKDYLYAFCHLDNKVLTFRIDRIQQATANGKKVDIVQYLADAYRNDDKDSTIGRQISKE